MYLSKDFLETVKYCEVKVCRNAPIKTQFKFHFKKWYKMPLKISMEWNSVAEEPGYWKQPEEINKIKQQLEEYFKII